MSKIIDLWNTIPKDFYDVPYVSDEKTKEPMTVLGAVLFALSNPTEYSKSSHEIALACYYVGKKVKSGIRLSDKEIAVCQNASKGMFTQPPMLGCILETLEEIASAYVGLEIAPDIDG